MLSFPILLALVALAGALRGPGDAAKHALTPTIVEQAGVPMERVDRTLVGRRTHRRRWPEPRSPAAWSRWSDPSNALLVDAASFALSASGADGDHAITRADGDRARRRRPPVPDPAADRLGVPPARARPDDPHADGRRDQPDRHRLLGGPGAGVGQGDRRGCGRRRPRLRGEERRIDRRLAGRGPLGRADAAVPGVRRRLPDRRRTEVPRARPRRTARRRAGHLRRRRIRVRVPQPDPRGRVLRTDPRADWSAGSARCPPPSASR